MIDFACIFTSGGVILFQKAFCQLKVLLFLSNNVNFQFDIIELLISRSLVTDKSNDKSYFCEPYRITWKKKDNLYFIVNINGFT